LDQEGILLGSSYKRLNANIRADQKITEKIAVNTSMNFSMGNANALMTNNGEEIKNLITQVTKFAPTNKLLGPGDTFEDFDYTAPQYRDSPYDIATKVVDDKEQINFLGSFGLDYKIIKDLTFNITGALTYFANNRDSYWPTTTQQGKASGGDAASSRNQSVKFLSQYQLSYNKRFRKIHNINAVVVHSYEKYQFREEFLSVKNFPTDGLTYKNLASGIDFVVPANNFLDTYLKSYLGRVNYDLKDRYLLTLAFRADGSSRFARNNKWGYFPSGAFAWRMIEEPFIKNLKAFSNLKLRLSYGKTGGQAIKPYQSLATLVTKNYTFDGNIASGLIEDNLENPNLKWENTNQYNAGIDFGFAKNRINLTIETYYKKTTDLLMLVDNPPSSGFANKIDNVGEVENRGIETELSASILDKRLKWNITGNIAFNRNKVLEMGVSGFQYSSYKLQAGYQPIIFKEGEPIGSFVGFQHLKIFETWDEVAKSAQPAANPGDMMFKDQNGDGIINDDDLTILGNPNPDATWGIANELRYRSFDVSVLIDGQIGGDIYSVDNMILESNFQRFNATTNAAGNSWTPAGGLPTASWTLPDGTLFSTEGYDYGLGNSDPYKARPMFNLNSVERKRTSDEYVKDATFVKLRNISIGYNFNLAKIKSIGFKNLRLYASATNILTITKFDGFDPEVTAFNNDPSRRGLDLGTYPASSSVTFGINATF
jgi:TonB-linked SusC/RagA family outer membrane protein